MYSIKTRLILGSVHLPFLKGATSNRNQIIEVWWFLFFPYFSLSSYEKCGISASQESWEVSHPTKQHKTKRQHWGEREGGELIIAQVLLSFQKDQSLFRTYKIRVSEIWTISRLNAFQEHSFSLDQKTNLGDKFAIFLRRETLLVGLNQNRVQVQEREGEEVLCRFC